MSSKPITRLLPSGDRSSLMRGVEVSVTCDETAYEGGGLFLLSAVLAQFFSRYVSINSFAETVVKTTTGSEVMRWPANLGRRLIL